MIWLVDDAYLAGPRVIGGAWVRRAAPRTQESTGLLFCAREASPGAGRARRATSTRHLSGLGACGGPALLAAISVPRVLSPPGWPHWIISETGGNPRSRCGNWPRTSRPISWQAARRCRRGCRSAAACKGTSCTRRRCSRLTPVPGCCSPRPRPATTLPRSGGRLRCWAWSPTPPIRPWPRTSPVDPRVAFRHPLIRSAVYEGARVGAGAGCTLPWRASPGGTVTRTRRRGTAPRPPSCPTRMSRLTSNARPRAERRGGYVAQATFLTRSAELTFDPRDRAMRYRRRPCASRRGGRCPRRGHADPQRLGWRKRDGTWRRSACGPRSPGSSRGTKTHPASCWTPLPPLIRPTRP